jgi:hypothetical protein
MALEVVKNKHGCDLRGEEGMEAAMAGRDDVNAENFLEAGYGQAKKYLMSCDTSTRVKDGLKDKAAQCPAACTVEALKELKECRNEDASKVVEGTCSSDNKKMDKDSFKSEFPNCAMQLESALKKSKPKKKIRSSMKVDVSDKDAILNAGNEEAVKIAAARAIAGQLTDVTEDEINVLAVSESTSRRLLSPRSGRDLAAGSVDIDYEVVLDEDSTADETAVENSVQNLNSNANAMTGLQQGLTTALEEESITGVSVTGATASTQVTVETITYAPTTAEPATGTTTTVAAVPASSGSVPLSIAALVVSAVVALVQ